MALIAKLYDNGRSAERHAIDADATVRGADQIPVDVLIADLSMTGCLFLTTEPLELESIITIGVAGIGRREARIVRAEDQRFGCVFITPLTGGELSAGLVQSETISPFPIGSQQVPVDPAPAAATPRYPGSVRLAAIVAMTVLSWIMLLVAIATLA